MKFISNQITRFGCYYYLLSYVTVFLFPIHIIIPISTMNAHYSFLFFLRRRSIHTHFYHTLARHNSFNPMEIFILQTFPYIICPLKENNNKKHKTRNYGFHFYFRFICSSIAKHQRARSTIFVFVFGFVSSPIHQLFVVSCKAARKSSKSNLNPSHKTMTHTDREKRHFRWKHINWNKNTYTAFGGFLNTSQCPDIIYKWARTLGCDTEWKTAHKLNWFTKDREIFKR